MDSSVILSVDNLEKYYPAKSGLGSVFRREKAFVRSVDGVSLSIKRGETLGLVGESGSGKTTLGRTVMMLQPPTGGTINFLGERISDFKGERLREVRRKMQIIFQNPYASLDPRQRVRDILAEPLKVFGYRKEQIRRKVSATIVAVGMPLASLNKFPHELSGGQRQRVAIARALVLDPEFIILDEPTSALDASVQVQILNLLRKIQEDRGITFLFITHNVNVVKYTADRIAVMYAGKLVEVGTARNVLTHPRHPYTIALITTVPKMDPNSKPASNLMAGEIPSAVNPPAGCRFNPRCPFVQSRCREEEPLLRNVEGNLVACHFAETIPEQLGEASVHEESRS